MISSDQTAVRRFCGPTRQAAAWAALANTQWVAGDFDGARRAGVSVPSMPYTIMRSWGLHKDAPAAWIVFPESPQALRQDGRALGDLCGRIQEYFRRHWDRPAGFLA